MDGFQSRLNALGKAVAEMARLADTTKVVSHVSPVPVPEAQDERCSQELAGKCYQIDNKPDFNVVGPEPSSIDGFSDSW